VAEWLRPRMVRPARSRAPDLLIASRAPASSIACRTQHRTRIVADAADRDADRQRLLRQAGDLIRLPHGKAGRGLSLIAQIGTLTCSLAQPGWRSERPARNRTPIRRLPTLCSGQSAHFARACGAAGQWRITATDPRYLIQMGSARVARCCIRAVPPIWSRELNCESADLLWPARPSVPANAAARHGK